MRVLGESGRRAQQGTVIRPRLEATFDRLWRQDDAVHGRLRPEDGEDLKGAARASPFNRSPTRTGRYPRSPGAGPSTTPAPTSSPEFVTPMTTQLDPLLQEPISELNTEELHSLRNWAEAGLGALTTPTTGTSTNNPVNLSTPGTVSQEDQRRQEERTKRKADESDSESESSEEEEEESPVSLDSDDEEYQGSETPSDPGQPETPPYQVNWPTTRSTPKNKPSRSKRKAARKPEQGSGSKTYKRRRG